MAYRRFPPSRRSRNWTLFSAATTEGARVGNRPEGMFKSRPPPPTAHLKVVRGLACLRIEPVIAVDLAVDWV
jgi:hypothetical protein